MKTKRSQTLGMLAIGVLLLTIFFLLLEFTDKHSSLLTFLSNSWKSIISHVRIPYCIEVWMNGTLTVVGFVVSLVFVIAFYIFLKQLSNWIRTINYQNRRGQNLQLLGSIMLLLWSIGWILFLQAFLYYKEEHVFVNSELLFRPAIASLDLFMLDIDSNILDQISGHAHLKGAISFVCVLSFACTLALLISLISARVWAYIKLNHCSKVNKSHSHIYIFFGLEKNMELLAKSITKEDCQSIRIFIEKTKNNEDDGKEGWNHLLAMLTHRREAFKKVKEMDARLALTNSSFSNLEISDNDIDVFGEAGLDNIKKLVTALKDCSEDAELHLFFLSENEDNNIESVNVIKKDLTINDVANNGVKVVVYCHARRNSVTRVIEHTSLDKKIEVRIIDSAHLAVEELKTKENIGLQPVSFVTIEGDGTTASKFNSLVIGFSEVGQDIVRFLYEYGAFVNSDRINGVRRSPFQCHVVDPNMEDIAPHYMDTHMRMGVSKTGEELPLISTDDHSPAFINLHSYGYKDKRFFKLLDEICDELNYVVIAIGDDLEGATLAIWLLKHAMRKKKDLSNFKILLRAYLPEKTLHVNKIIDYYNGLFYAEMVNKANIKQQNTNDNKIIHLFGEAENIYSYMSIVSNQIRKESWSYYNSYYGVEEKTDNDFARLEDNEKATGRYCSISQPDYAWNIRRQKEIKIRIHEFPLYSGVMSVRRKEAQDIENALHRHTKRFVAKKALGSEEMLRKIESGIRHQTIIRDDKNRYFENKEEKKDLETLMTTLAQMEHLRWNASHEMLGYVWGEKKDEAFSEHDCLVCWEELASDEIRGYDYDVVDRSFRLADEEFEK